MHVASENGGLHTVRANVLGCVSFIKIYFSCYLSFQVVVAATLNDINAILKSATADDSLVGTDALR